MFDSMFNFWLIFGVILIFAEILLPGLVSVFVGLGAITVSALLHYGYIDNLPSQLTTWFVSSTLYIFTLRLLVMRYYPSDSVTQDIDEDHAVIGQMVEVIDPISRQSSGRIRFGDSTWVAVSVDDEEIGLGEKVRVVGRKDISWIVKRVSNEES
jgi:hypothetical protein